MNFEEEYNELKEKHQDLQFQNEGLQKRVTELETDISRASFIGHNLATKFGLDKMSSEPTILIIARLLPKLQKIASDFEKNKLSEVSEIKELYNLILKYNPKI